MNISADIFVGLVKGGIENVSGLTVNANFTLGPVSLSLFVDPKTGELIGGTAGLGPPFQPPIGASGTLSHTSVGTLRDLIGFIFGRNRQPEVCR